MGLSNEDLNHLLPSLSFGHRRLLLNRIAALTPQTQRGGGVLGVGEGAGGMGSVVQQDVGGPSQEVERSVQPTGGHTNMQGYPYYLAAPAFLLPMCMLVGPQDQGEGHGPHHVDRQLLEAEGLRVYGSDGWSWPDISVIILAGGGLVWTVCRLLIRAGARPERVPGEHVERVLDSTGTSTAVRKSKGSGSAMRRRGIGNSNDKGRRLVLIRVRVPVTTLSLAHKIRWYVMRTFYKMQPMAEEVKVQVQTDKADLSAYPLLELPPDLHEKPELRSLQELRVSSVRLPSLPEWLGDLVHLEALNLEGCTILSRLPDSLEKLTRLLKLDLSKCESLTALPEGIGKLTELQSLNLHWCTQLTSLAVGIEQLPKLEMLNMRECYRLKELPNNLCGLTQVMQLQLRGCIGLTELPASIGSLMALRTLNLGGCHRLKVLPESMDALSNLTYLDVAECRSITELPQQLEKQMEKRHLFAVRSGWYKRKMVQAHHELLRGQEVSVNGDTELLQLPGKLKAVTVTKLTELQLKDCHRLDVVPPNVWAYTALTDLSLRGCEGMKVLPEDLSSLEQLRHLDLQGCTGLTGLPKAIGCLVMLDVLNLGGCENLRALPETVGCLVALTWLDLAFCKQLQGLPVCLCDLTALKTLSVDGCASLHKQHLDLQLLVNKDPEDKSPTRVLQFLRSLNHEAGQAKARTLQPGAEENSELRIGGGSPPMMRVRPATVRDGKAIAELAGSLAIENVGEVSKDSMGFLVSGYTTEEYEDFARRVDHFLVVDTGEQIVAFLLAYGSDKVIVAKEELNAHIKAKLCPDFVVIKQICTHRDYMGKGYAQLLYKELFARMLLVYHDKPPPVFTAVIKEPLNTRSVAFHKLTDFVSIATYTPTDGMGRIIFKNDQVRRTLTRMLTPTEKRDSAEIPAVAELLQRSPMLLST
jgi:Leucine-rich repeat (LRR) protein/ribosomal protein S18 acetylase RimI-like enzyme